MGLLRSIILWPDLLANLLHPTKARKVVVTDNCNGTQTVTGANIRTVDRHLQGTTVEGNRSRVATSRGGGKWTIHSEEWNTKFDCETVERERRRKGMK